MRPIRSPRAGGHLPAGRRQAGHSAVARLRLVAVAPGNPLALPLGTPSAQPHELRTRGCASQGEVLVRGALFARGAKPAEVGPREASRRTALIAASAAACAAEQARHALGDPK